MKRVTVIAFVCTLVVLSSCTFGLNPMGYEVKHGDLDSAWKHVASFEYQDDPKGYWKSPVEFERDGGGDCEDFAIWCYGEMLRNGVQDFDLELCIGYATIRGEEITHAVLCSSFDTQGPLGIVTNVLDCLQSHVVTEEWLLRYFKPEYYINRLGWRAA